MDEGIKGHVFVNLEDEGDKIVINGKKAIMFNSNEVRDILERVAKRHGLRCRFPEKKKFDNLPPCDYMNYVTKILEHTEIVILFCDFGDVFVKDLLSGYYTKFLETNKIAYPMMLINWCPTNSNDRYKKSLEEKAGKVINSSDISEIEPMLEEYLRAALSSGLEAFCYLAKKVVINSSGITMRD
jgi:hypothetical protein